jgi:hypothetical protein
MKFTIASLVACLMATETSAARLSAMKHKIAEHKELPEEIYYEDMLDDVEQAFQEDYPEEYEAVMSSMNLSMVLSDVPDQKDIAKAGVHHKVDKEIEDKMAVDEEEVVLVAIPDQKDVAKAGVHHKVDKEIEDKMADDEEYGDELDLSEEEVEQLEQEEVVLVAIPDQKDVAKAGVHHKVDKEIEDKMADDEEYGDELDLSEEEV